MKRILFILLALMAGTFLQAQEQLPDTSLFEAHCHIEGNDTLPYRLYRSMAADTMPEPLPLVIFLHGAGERGNDNCTQLKHCIKYFLDDTVTARHPFLLMAPQCPPEKRWVNTDWSLSEHTMDSMPTAELLGVMTVLDSLVDVGVVDSTQVYICGISMGGFGTWDALQRWPGKFAAAIAICGGGDPAYADVMKDIPVYIFHGMLDGVVMPSRSIQMYNALKFGGVAAAMSSLQVASQQPCHALPLIPRPSGTPLKGERAGIYGCGLQESAHLNMKTRHCISGWVRVVH